MRHSASVAILVLAATLSAQAPRFAQVGDPLPDGMGQIVGSADFEGDGDVDLFSTSGVFLNTGGHFVAGPKLPPSFVPWINVYSIAIRDFTGDGRVDVLVGRAGGTPAGLVLYVAPPVGGTTFTVAPGAFAGAPLVLLRFEVIDFDLDGDTDVIAASHSTGTPLWQLFENDGLGTFTAAPPAIWPPELMEASWIGVGDFDGDILPDVVATNSSGGVWRRNIGFAFGPTQSLGSTLVADRGVVGDFDGDGDADALVIAVTGDEVIYNGAGPLPVPGAVTFGGIAGTPPIVADLDGNGFADVFRTVVEVSGGTAGDLLVRSGGPTGLGAPWPIGKAKFAFGSPMPFAGLAVLDVEGDGDADVAFGTGFGAPGLAINVPPGFVWAQQTIPYGFDALYAPPHDVDGDGDLDLLRGSVSSFVVSLEVARNDGRGVFSGPFPAGSYGGFLGRAIWSDLDADGDSDLWVQTFLTPSSGTAVLNNGNGVFSGAAGASNLGPAAAFATGDFDGNGVPDIVIGRAMTAAFPPVFHQPLLVKGFVNAGVLSYAAAVPFGVAEIVREIVALDVEPDGDLDLLVATGNGAGTAPRLYTNNGLGAFTAGAPFAGVTAGTVAAAELSGDSLVDLVLGSQVWTNTGAGFAPASTHAAPVGLVTVVDVDLDGDLDLVDSAGLWYPGIAGAAFGAPVAFVPFTPAAPVQLAPWKAVVADFDADGDPDLVGPDWAQSSLLTVYSNLTRHAGRRALAVSTAPVELAVFGAPGTPWVLGASFAGTPPISLPPFGTLFLDPATLGIFGSGVIPAGGRSDFTSIMVPQPVSGFTIAWQALVGMNLSNGFDTFIL